MAAESATGADVVLALDLGTTDAKALLVDASTRAVVARGAGGSGSPTPRRAGWSRTPTTGRPRSPRPRCAWGRRPARCRPSSPAPTSVSRSSSAAGPRGNRSARSSAGRADAPQTAARHGPAAATLVRQRTSLTLDPKQSASPKRWLLDAAAGAGADEAGVCLGTVDAWLVWRITRGALVATEAGERRAHAAPRSRRGRRLAPPRGARSPRRASSARSRTTCGPPQSPSVTIGAARCRDAM